MHNRSREHLREKPIILLSDMLIHTVEKASFAQSESLCFIAFATRQAWLQWWAMNPHKETLFRVGDFEILRNGRLSPLFLFFCKNSIVYRWEIDTIES